jgi:hypothetical protein
MINSCRHCASTDTLDFLDLGFAPPSNAYLQPDELLAPELTYPLKLFVCRECRLVQTVDFARADSFFTKDYAYFSSTSKSWVEHARRYCDDVTTRLKLDEKSFVIEIASNDGYLLRNFVEAKIPCLGVEPTQCTAEIARSQNIPVTEAFFGAQMANDLPKADLIIGNNVFAHVPDINDFAQGMANCLTFDGVITLEFPHLLNLVQLRQFDTVYHEHFSYLSLIATEKILTSVGLKIFDVEELSTHGGSLRIFACHQGSHHTESDAVVILREKEQAAHMGQDDFYKAFQTEAENVKNAFVSFLQQAKADGLTVAGYGAAAKGNTLMNFSGIRSDLLSFVSDAAESKIGKFLPGSHIPILHPDSLRETVPDILVIFPWNIAPEIISGLSDLKDVRKFVFIPELREV